MHMGTTRDRAVLVREDSVHPHAHGDNVADKGCRSYGSRFTPMHMGTTLGIV